MLELRALKIAEGSRLRHKLPRRFADSVQRKAAQWVCAMDTPLPRQTAASWTVNETDTVLCRGGQKTSETSILRILTTSMYSKIAPDALEGCFKAIRHSTQY